MSQGKKRRGGRRHRTASKAKPAVEESCVATAADEEEHGGQQQHEAWPPAEEPSAGAEEAERRGRFGSGGRRDGRGRRDAPRGPKGAGEAGEERRRNGLRCSETEKFARDATGSKQKRHDRRRGGNASQLGEYFTHIREVLEQKKFHSEEEWDTFVTATTEEIASNAQLLLCDRRCSKVVEKIIGAVAELLWRASRSSSGGGVNQKRAGAAAEDASPSERDAERTEAVLRAFTKLLRQIVGRAGQLARDPTGSHVLQTLLLSLPPVLLAEAELRRGRLAAAAEKRQNEEEGEENLQHDEQTIEDLTVYCLHCLQAETGGWVSLMRDACGSHVLRAAIVVCAGLYAPQVVESGGRRSGKALEEYLSRGGEVAAAVSRPAAVAAAASRRGREEGEGEGGAGGASETGVSSLPRPLHVSRLLLAALRSIALEVAAAVDADPYTFLFDIYASPAIQLLLSVLSIAKDCSAEQAKLLAAVLRMPAAAEKTGSTARTQEATETMQQLADALVNSAVGSRLLEVAVPLLRDPQLFQRFFSSWISKRLNSLAQGKFGNFFLQKLLASSVLQAPHLLQIISTLDVGACVEAGTSGVLWRVAEACRRLREGYFPFTKNLWAAIGDTSTQQQPHQAAAVRYVWLCLLALKRPSQLSPQLLQSDEDDGREDGTAVVEEKQATAAGTAAAAGRVDSSRGLGDAAAGAAGQETTSPRDAAAAEENPRRGESESGKARRTLRHLSELFCPMGLSLVISLLKFPPAAVQPLVLGFKSFLATLRSVRFLSRKWPRDAQQQHPVFEEIPLLLRLATDPQGSRFLEAIVKAGGAAAAGGAATAATGGKNDAAAGGRLLPPAAVQRLAKAFVGSYAAAALHPAAGFVVGTLYEAASLPTKRRIVEELLPVEDELRERNYKLYRICELYRYKQSEEAWTERQEKKRQMRTLFSDLLCDDADALHEVGEDGRAAANFSSPWTPPAAASAAAASLSAPSEDAAADGLSSNAEEHAEEKTKTKKKEKQMKAEKHAGAKKSRRTAGDDDSAAAVAAASLSLESRPGDGRKFVERSGFNAEGGSEAVAAKQQQQQKKQRKSQRREEKVDGAAVVTAAAEDVRGEKQPSELARKKKKRKVGDDDAGGARPAAAAAAGAAGLIAGAGAAGEKVDSLDAALYFIEGTRQGLSKRELSKRKKIEAEKVARVTGFDATSL